jgi:hypothetical protein
MIRRFVPASLVLLAACSGQQSNEEALRNAANQSDPAAAAVLNNAAENGVDPQQALQQAGQAAATNVTAGNPPSGSVQARPNTAQDPNPGQPGQPPEKTVVNGQ